MIANNRPSSIVHRQYASSVGRGRLANVAGLLLAVVGLGSYLWWLYTAGSSASVWGWDFRAYYAATHALVSGGNLYELGSPTTPFYLYPPALAFLFLPLGALSLPVATLLWNVLQHVCLLLVGIIAVWLTGNGVALWSPLLRGGLLLFLWGTGVPLHDEIYLGQVNGFVLLLLLASLVIVRPWDQGGVRSLPPLVAGGLLLGLTISVKVQPLLLLPLFVLWGSWRFAVAGGLGFVAVQAATIPFTASTLDYWINLFPDLLGRSQSYIDNQSINGLTSRWLLPNPLFTLPINNAQAVWKLTNTGASLLALMSVALVLVWPAFSAWRRKALQASAQSSLASVERRLLMLLHISLVLVSINLTSYVTWPHHEIWWVVAALSLIGWWVYRGRVPVAGVLSLAAIALVFSRSPGDWLHLVDAQQHPYWALVLSGMHMYALLLLWVVLVATLVRQHRSGEPSRAAGTRIHSAPFG